MTIQMFKPTYRIEECLEEIKECLTVGWTGLGFKTETFEEAWKNYTQLPNAHFLNSATAGLHLAIKIFKESENWKDGDECITTPLTFISDAHSISYERMKPVFADVDEYLCIDPIDLEKKITKKTKAVMYVGMGGTIGKYYEIVDICKKYNLKLILDAAHMAGTRHNGEIVGKEADVIIYSFQAVKNLPTADSGMICFKDTEYDTIARKMAWLGINKNTYDRSTNSGSYKWKYDVEYIGNKYHGNSIIASIGLVQLKYLDYDNSYRRQVAKWYDANFCKQKNIKLIPTIPNCESSQHLYIIQIENRDELLLALNQCEIYPGVHYEINTNYRMYEYGKGTCPNAEVITKNILSLPLHLQLTKKDVDFISEKVIQYAK